MSDAPADQMRPLSVTPLSRVQLITLLCIVAFAALIRLIWLDHIPPGLWYDEAIYALDGWDVAHGQFPMFFETEGHMREPMYIYSLGAFFALFGASTLKARIVSALWGTATVALFFPVARRFFGSRDALLATFAFAVFRWHLHFSRTIFRALLPPFFILLVLLFWLRWREKHRDIDAWLCGLCLGAGMYTYLSFRLVPVLLIGIVAWELAHKRIAWRSHGRGLAGIAAGAIITFLPLGVDYILHPVHFTGRTSEISMFEKTIRVRGADGQEVEQQVRKPTREAIRDLLGNTVDVAKMWTIRGDHVGKHNLPYEPVFDWASGCVFYLGLIWCVAQAWRVEFAFVTVLWIAILSLTSVFSFGAPNLLRMQGMTPAVIFCYAAGLRFLYELMGGRVSLVIKNTAIVSLIVLFAGAQLYVYFVKFPASVLVRNEFTADIFYAPADGVRQVAENGRRVYVPQELADTATFRFVTAGLSGIKVYQPTDDLSSGSLNGSGVLVTGRSLQLARDAGHDQLAELRSHASKLHSNYTLPIADDRGLEISRQKWAELLLLQPRNVP